MNENNCSKLSHEQDGEILTLETPDELDPIGAHVKSKEATMIDLVS